MGWRGGWATRWETSIFPLPSSRIVVSPANPSTSQFFLRHADAILVLHVLSLVLPSLNSFMAFVFSMFSLWCYHHLTVSLRWWAFVMHAVLLFAASVIHAILFIDICRGTCLECVYGETSSTIVNCQAHSDADDHVFLKFLARCSLPELAKQGN